MCACVGRAGRGQSGPMEMSTAPATPAHWDDVVTAFGRRGADPSWCWCQRFLDRDASNNREALRNEVSTATVAPGLVAYVDGEPAGWTRVMPRRAVPAVLANRALRRVLADDAPNDLMSLPGSDGRAIAEHSGRPERRAVGPTARRDGREEGPVRPVRRGAGSGARRCRRGSGRARSTPCGRRRPDRWWVPRAWRCACG